MPYVNATATIEAIFRVTELADVEYRLNRFE